MAIGVSFWVIVAIVDSWGDPTLTLPSNYRDVGDLTNFWYNPGINIICITHTINIFAPGCDD